MTRSNYLLSIVLPIELVFLHDSTSAATAPFLNGPFVVCFVSKLIYKDMSFFNYVSNSVFLIFYLVIVSCGSRKLSSTDYLLGSLEKRMKS